MPESYVDKEVAKWLRTQGIMPTGTAINAAKQAISEDDTFAFLFPEAARLQELIRHNVIEGEVVEDGNTNSYGGMVAYWEEHKERP